jgi:hypothetical protein
MKKRVPKEPLLNTLARQVGHAAGTIAKTAQQLASDAAAMVQTEPMRPAKARTKTAKKARRGAVPKQKKKATKTAARKSRTRVRKTSKH